MLAPFQLESVHVIQCTIDSFQNKSELIHEPENYSLLLPYMVWCRFDWVSSWQEVGPSCFTVQHKMHKSRNCRLRSLCAADAAWNELIANVTPFCSRRIHVQPLFQVHTECRLESMTVTHAGVSPPHSHCFISLEMFCTLKLIWLISNSLWYTRFRTDSILTKRSISWIAIWSKHW